MPSLNQADIERYRRDGFLFPLPALDGDELAAVRANLKQLEQALGGPIEGLMTKQLHLHFPWAADLAKHPALVAAARSLLGNDVLVHSTSLFCKVSGRHVAWHQDGYYWQLDSPRLVSAWLAISASNEENGCMRVIPASHRESLPHETRHDPGHMLATGLALTNDPNEKSAENITLEPGQFSLHHVNAVHGSGPNRTNTPRMGFAVRYIAAAVRQKLPHHPVLLACGHHAQGHFEIAEPPTAAFNKALNNQHAFAKALAKTRLSPEVAGAS